MRRVSSRQRLVSWDAFDATVHCESSDASSEFAYHDALDDEHPLKRKRSPKSREEPSTDLYSESAATTVPAYDWEIQSKKEDNSVLRVLSDDVQLQLLEFCDLDSLRNVMQVNHSFRNLLASEEAHTLWLQACQHRWSWLPSDSRLVDDLKLTAVLTADESCMDHSRLLSLAASKSATRTDQTIFAPCRWSRSLRRFRPRHSTTTVELKALQVNGRTAVQFTGHVGLGDRCIRGDEPLARPVLLEPHDDKSMSSLLLQRLSSFHCQRSNTIKNVWKPFVAPFCGSNGCIQMTPRLISYFEVSILPRSSAATDNNASSNTSNNDSERFDYTETVRRRRPPASECVAVGLATEDFSLHTRMPGWDRCSYGYHGDDGGLFHGKGNMVRQYGPKYGVGDTIGCGIDFYRQSIFFTRNGEFLGYAFENMDMEILQQDLYPVVGMDTNCPVACNFGADGPFAFDLEAMMNKERSVVLQSLGCKK